MCLTPHWVPVPESSERGRSVTDGSQTPAVPLIAYGTESGEADSAPEVPLPYSLAAIILEVAPVQTQTLTQTDAGAAPGADGTAPDAEADALSAVPAQSRAMHHPESEPEPEEPPAEAVEAAEPPRSSYRPRPVPIPAAPPRTCSASTCGRSAASPC